MFKRIVFGLICTIPYLSCLAQEVEVRGYFMEDSLQIGMGTPYVLTARYPASADVLFPDSLFDYSPFELGEKKFYPTQTSNGISYDSAIYYLLSFEVDSVQYASLPVFQVVGQDSMKIMAAEDAIILQHMVAEIPDSVAAEAMPLMENTTYKYVQLALNYPYLITGILAAVLLIIGIWVAFGKKIRRWFRLRKMQKQHVRYTEDFQKLVGSTDTTRELLLLWKSYHEGLEHVPYTKMTTKELMKLEAAQRVEEPLKEIDRTLYGNKPAPSRESLERLLHYSKEQYQHKVNELKHG